jgi:hypothetical protein
VLLKDLFHDYVIKYVMPFFSNSQSDIGWDMQDEELGGAKHSPKIVHIEAQVRLAEFSITGERIEDIALVSDSIVRTEAAAAERVRKLLLLHCCTSIEAPAHA